MFLNIYILIFRAIKREFRRIEYLFTELNFEDIYHQKPGVPQINATMVKSFVSRMIDNYCLVFRIECNER